MRRRLASYWADAIEPRLFIVRQLPTAGWPLVTVVGVLNVVLGVLPIVFVVTTSVLIGRVPAASGQPLDSPAWSALVVAFLIASAAFFARQLLAPVVTSIGAVVKHRVNGVFRDRLIAISLRSIGIGPLEDDDALSSLDDAADDLEFGFRTPGDATVGTLAYLARYTELAGYVVVLGVVWSWPAAAAVTVCVLCFRYGHRGGLRFWLRVFPKQQAFRRTAHYFRDLGMLAPAAKELRVFGLTRWTVGHYRKQAMAALVPLWAERRRATVHLFFWYAAVGVVIACTVLALLVRSAAAGELTLTELVLALQVTIAAIALGNYYTEADDQSLFGMLSARALEDFDRKVTRMAPDDVAAGAERDAAGLPGKELRFEGVRFTYPGTARPVLDGLELSLRAGECTAIVGLNGAGKTTLVKLLARLHEPTEGRLVVDGVDVRDYTVDSWRRQIGVIFQDFNRYELSVLDNVSFGAVQREVDEAAVRATVARVGLLEAVDALPRGLNTPLSREYEDGAQLSGGQWQRVAIARALYGVAAGAKVLVLDEPTAALDVRAEAAFFDQFVELTRGVTALLISHRFSSVRHADRIVVLEHGRVVEDGTHESLLAAGGRYAHLFNLQAERFRRGLGAEGEPLADLEAAE